MIFIDLFILFKMLQPNLTRKVRLFAFLKTTSDVINDTQIQLESLYNDVKYDLTFNGQTIYLEHFLNDQYDNVLRRIKIEDIDSDETLYLFNKVEENEETHLFNSSENEDPVYFVNQSESISSIDFQILVPSDIQFNELVMRKRFDRYRLAGPNYEIVIV